MSEYNRVYTLDEVITQPNPYLIVQTKFMHYDMSQSELDAIIEIVYNNYSDTETEKILFNQLSEGLQLGILKPLDYITRRLEQLGVPKDKFVLLSGAVDCPENKKYYSERCEQLGLYEIAISFANSFQHRMKNIILAENLHGNHSRPIGFKKKKFICFNRNIKHHRLFVTAETIRRNLLDKAYFSMYLNGTEADGMAGMRTNLEYYQNWHHYLPNKSESAIQILNDNQHLFPIRLSLQANLHLPHGIRTDLNLFDDSYFGVITESKYFVDSGIIADMKVQLSMDCYFFTEKTYKFIAAKMPFVFVGFNNSLKILQNMGYKTFSPYINESYDSIENDEERLVAIMDEIERLSNLSDTEWHELEKNLLPIVNHNYGVLTEK